MATLHSIFIPTLVKFLIHSFLLLLPGLLHKTHAFSKEHNFHTIHGSSLFPDNPICKPSTGSRKGASTMEVIHRYGPCSAQSTATVPTLREILSHDQLRVRSIQARLARDRDTNQINDNKANLPAQLGSSLGTANYIVSVGLGSPKQTVSLAFDTGSDVTWTQCQPCAGSCYSQQDPVFDPSKSSSYSNISCASPQCSELSSRRTCTGTTCVYRVLYGDQSFTIGFYAKETIALTPTDVFPNFQFGCGQDNTGLFAKTAGILGLGRAPQSVISQTAQKYNKYFSYCLPSTSSTTGHLTFGKSSASTSNVKFTPFGIPRGTETSFYFIDIVGISVGGRQVLIDQSVFKTSGNIIDSGTVITRLQPTAYTAMRTVFRQLMTKYPLTQGAELFDTCYDFSNFVNSNITLPTVAFILAGDVRVDLEVPGILRHTQGATMCLAFAPNGDDSEVGIFGNTQQKTLEVVYDVARGKIGFGAGGCN